MFIIKGLKHSAVGILILLLLVRPARAYLDPGTTSMMLQVIIGVFVGGAVAIKIYWNKLKVFIRGITKLDKQKNN